MVTQVKIEEEKNVHKATSAKEQREDKKSSAAGLDPTMYVQEAPKTDIFDNLSKVVVDPTGGPALSTKKVPQGLSIGKPAAGKYYRMHPDLSVTVYVTEIDGEGFDRPLCLVVPDLVDVFPGAVKAVRLTLCVNALGQALVWKTSRHPGVWQETADNVISAGVENWVRVKSGGSDIGYEGEMPQDRAFIDKLGEPVWPADVPDVATMLRKVFKPARIIDTEEHPVFKEMAGRV